MPRELRDRRVRDATCLTDLRETSLSGGSVDVGNRSESGGGGARYERAERCARCQDESSPPGSRRKREKFRAVSKRPTCALQRLRGDCSCFVRSMRLRSPIGRSGTSHGSAARFHAPFPAANFQTKLAAVCGAASDDPGTEYVDPERRYDYTASPCMSRWDVWLRRPEPIAGRSVSGRGFVACPESFLPGPDTCWVGVQQCWSPR